MQAGSSELGAPTSRVVGSLHDSCASPAVIDLSPLAGGGRIEVPIDVTGAKKDYGGCLDFTFPAGHVDVALELRDVPALLEFTCTGGARIGIASGAATSCPPTLGQCYAGNCSPGNSLEQSMPPHAFVLIALPPDATNTTLVLSAR